MNSVLSFIVLSCFSAVGLWADTLNYDFKNKTLQGWTVVLGTPGYINGGVGAETSKGEDNPHPTLLLRSPMFRLDRSGDLNVGLLSGAGGHLPASARALSKQSTKGGPMGIALRRVTDDAYVIAGQLSKNATREILKFSRKQLATLTDEAKDEVYTLDFFDAGHGGWGHTELLNARIPGTLIEPLPAPPPDLNAPRPLFLGTLHGKLAYDKTDLYATPGSALSLTVYNTDEMAHNWLLCTPGPKVADQIGLYVMSHIPELSQKEFVPEDDRILLASRLVQPGTSETLYFSAPEKMGDYPFVCTFPGHHQTMRGILHIVPELPEPKPRQIKQIKKADPYSIAAKEAPVIQRGPLRGGGSAVICVGTPEGINFAFDTTSCTISHVWQTTGDGFLNTKGAWGGRGGKAVQPQGAMKFTGKADGSLQGDARFRYYDLNANGLPTFVYTIDGKTEVRVDAQPTADALVANYVLHSNTAHIWKLERGQTIAEQTQPGTDVSVSKSFTVRYTLSN